MLKAVSMIAGQLRLTHKYCFGQGFREARERALWATKFIQIIRGDGQLTPNPPNSTMHLTLSDQLRDCSLDPTLQAYKSGAIEEEMKAMFKSGILLNSKIFSQNRIEKGKIESNSQDRPFVFIPTVLVTRPIFTYIKVNREPQTLFYGLYGVGKTSSLIAYAVLSSFISKYLHMAVDSKDASECKLAKELLDNKFIENARKVFYYSISKVYNKMKMCIASQLTELSEQEQKNAQSLQMVELVKIIQEKYYDGYLLDLLGQKSRNRLNTIVIIDQINALAAVYRNYNTKIEQIGINPSTTVEYKKLRLNQESLRLSSIQEYVDWLRYFLESINENIIFNSSINIEIELLLEKQKGSVTTMNLINKHAGLNKQKLEYFQQLQTESGQQSFKDYFWEELQLRLTKPGRTDNVDRLQINLPISESQMLLSEARQIFIEEMQKHRILATWRFLFVREALDTLSVSTNRFLSHPTKSLFQRLIQKIIKEIEERGQSSFINRVLAQSLKGSVTDIRARANLFFDIYSNLQGLQKQFNMQPETIKQMIESDKKEYEIDSVTTPSLYDKFTQLLKAGLINQELLQFQTEQTDFSQKIVFFITRAELRQIMKKIIRSTLLNFAEKDEKLLSNFVVQKLQNKQALGIFMELCFAEFVSYENAEFAIEAVKLTKPRLIHAFQQQNKSLFSTDAQRLAVVTNFLKKTNLTEEDKQQIPKEILKTFFIQRKQQILQFLSPKAIKMTKFSHLPLLMQLTIIPNKNCILIVKKNKNGEEEQVQQTNEKGGDRQHNNPVFDFAVLRYSKPENQAGVYVWHTFDYTISKYLKGKIISAHQKLTLYHKNVTEGISALANGLKQPFEEISDETAIKKYLKIGLTKEEKRKIEEMQKDEKTSFAETVFNISKSPNTFNSFTRMLRISKDQILYLDNDDQDKVMKIGAQNEKIKIIHTIICLDSSAEQIIRETCKGNLNRKYSNFVAYLGNDDVEINVAPISKANLKKSSAEDVNSINNYKVYQQLKKQYLS